MHHTWAASTVEREGWETPSLPPSSIRTCGFPAYGFPTNFFKWDQAEIYHTAKQFGLTNDCPCCRVYSKLQSAFPSLNMPSKDYIQYYRSNDL